MLLGALSALAGVLLATLLLSYYLGVSPLTIFDQFSLYIPNNNILLPLTLDNFSYNQYFIGIMVFSYMFFLVFKKFIHPPLPPLLPNRPSIIGILFFLLIFSCSLQTIGLYRYFYPLISFFAHKSPSQKHAIVSNDISKIAEAFQSYLPRKTSAQLVTDLDLSRDPGMITQRRLAYYLYPIDIRGIRGEPPSYILLFKKKDAIRHIPEGFRLYKAFTNDIMIAIRKEK